MEHILIGGAWPYANGSLHIGHVAALLPGDVLARYWRAKGKSVFYVSGSDCYGTPITIRAKQEGLSPQEISDFYHKEFVDVFENLGFSYDFYTKTSDTRHIEFVKNFHCKMYEGAYVKPKQMKQAWCPTCCKTLTDRLIVGSCPSCGAATRGDQCDACGQVLEADMVSDAHCFDCGNAVEFKQATQLYLLTSKLENQLQSMLDSHPEWRKNAITFTKRYINEGLRDRAITRDLDWGIDVPMAGYEDKKIYIWAENVLGYLSAADVLCCEREIDFAEVFGQNARHYYVHGKDNIPFHTIILPALLMAQGDDYRLPDDIISSEYVTLEGRRISTSRDWAVWVKDIIGTYHPDVIRYFFIANGPEKRDTDFSWREFMLRNNADLVGAWGNFVNRTLVFIQKYNGNRVPEGSPDKEAADRISQAFTVVGRYIEDGRFKEALEAAFELVNYGNKYYDAREPWKTRTSDPLSCDETLYNCVQMIGNLSLLLAPFLPFTSDIVMGWLGIEKRWSVCVVKEGIQLPPLSVLFRRIDDSEVKEQQENLGVRKSI